VLVHHQSARAADRPPRGAQPRRGGLANGRAAAPSRES